MSHIHYYPHIFAEITIQLNDVSAHMEHSTNTQEHDDSMANLHKQLHMEYPNIEGANMYESLLSACVDTAHDHGVTFNKVLDLGCGCGRLSFGLSNHFKLVSEIFGGHSLVRILG